MMYITEFSKSTDEIDRVRVTFDLAVDGELDIDVNSYRRNRKLYHPEIGVFRVISISADADWMYSAGGRKQPVAKRTELHCELIGGSTPSVDRGARGMDEESIVKLTELESEVIEHQLGSK